MATSFDQVANYGIPILLLLIMFGFVYTKFLSPFVVPWMMRLWEWMKGKGEGGPKIGGKELTFE